MISTAPSIGMMLKRGIHGARQLVGQEGLDMARIDIGVIALERQIDRIGDTCVQALGANMKGRRQRVGAWPPP